MGAEVADLWVTLRAITAPFTEALVGAGAEADRFITQLKAMDVAATGTGARLREMGVAAERGAAGLGAAGREATVAGDRMAASGEKASLMGSKFLGLSGVFAKVSKFGSLGLAGIAVEAVKMGSSFQAEMMKINTQAGVSKNQLGSLGNGVLKLAGQVGFSPNSLAESLFHVESNFASLGITGPKALDLVKIAAEGAAVGHANLVDVTNALTAAVASGIPGVQNMSQAMGVLNAIVGSGDMNMQDLANALSTGMVAAVKGYGLSIADVGAGLATFGDNNMRGSAAATNLRMAVQALAVPAKGAGVYLQQFGWTAHTLGQDMQKGGLKLALEDLTAKFKQTGITSAQQGEVITQMFGKKAGTGLSILMGQMDRVESKYPALTAGASKFGDAWTTTQHNLSQQLKDIRFGFDAVMVRIGQFLIPQVSKLITLLEGKATPVVKALGAALSGIASGFTGHTAKAPVQAQMAGGRLGAQDAGATAAPLTGWQKAGEILRGVATDVKKFAADAAKAFGQLAQAAGPTLALLGGAALVALRAIASILANVLGPALVKVTGFMNQHKTIVRDLILVALIPLAIRLAALSVLRPIGAVANLAADIARFPVSQISKIGEAYKSTMDSIKAAGTAVKELAVGQRLAAAAAKVQAAAQWLLDAAMDANPVVLIVLAIMALIGVLVYAYFHCTAFREAVQAAFRGVEAAAKAVWSALQAVWAGLVAGVTAVWHAMVSVWNAVASVTTTVWNGIIGFFKKWWPLLLVLFLPVIAVLISIWTHFHKQIADTAASVWNKIAGFFKAVWNTIVAIATAYWQLFQACIINPVKAVWNWLQPAFHAIAGFLSSVWSGIQSVAASAWNGIKTAIINPITAAWHMVVSVVGNIGSAIWNGLVAAWHAVENIGSWFLGIGSAIVNGIISGVENAGSALFGTLKNLANDALNAAKSFLGINSPSKLFADHVGMAIPEGIALGVDDNAHLAHRAVTSLSSGLLGAASGALAAGRGLAVNAGIGASAGAGGTGGGVVNITVQGTIVSERQLGDLIERLNLQRGGRNSQTYQAYRR